jgi:hypothetical protein
VKDKMAEGLEAGASRVFRYQNCRQILKQAAKVILESQDHAAFVEHPMRPPLKVPI